MSDQASNTDAHPLYRIKHGNDLWAGDSHFDVNVECGNCGHSHMLSVKKGALVGTLPLECPWCEVKMNSNYKIR